MTLQTSTKAARIGSRFVALGKRHENFDARIREVSARPNPDQIVLTRLKREKLRIRDEMQHYEGVLRMLGHQRAG